MIALEDCGLGGQKVLPHLQTWVMVGEGKDLLFGLEQLLVLPELVLPVVVHGKAPLLSYVHGSGQHCHGHLGDEEGGPHAEEGGDGQVCSDAGSICLAGETLPIAHAHNHCLYSSLSLLSVQHLANP